MDKNRRTPLAVVLVMSIIIVALVYGFFVRPNYHLVNGGTIYMDAVYAGKLDVRRGARLATMNDMLYEATREGLTKLSLDGEHIWNKSYHFNELLFIEEAPYMAAVDITGKDAFIFDENGEVAHIQTDFGIVTGSINQSGYLVLVTENGGQHYIRMFKFDGEEVVYRRTIFRDDGYPIYVATSDDATKMMTSHLYVSKHMIESEITFLNYSPAGEAYSDRVVANQNFQETMASSLHFFGNDYGVVIGDNKLAFYKIDVTPELIKTIDIETVIEDYAVTEEALVISYGEAIVPEGEKHSDKVVSYSKSGEIVAELTFEEDVTDLTADDETYFVIQSSHITRYRDDKAVWDTQLHKDANEIYELSGNRYLVIYPYGYEILKIDDI